MEREYACPACRTGFPTPEALNDHGLRMHAGRSEATR